MSSQRLAVDDGLIAWLSRVATAPATITLAAVVSAFIVGRILVAIARPVLARAQLEAVLRGHPKIWPSDIVVRFKELAASSLDIEIGAWFQTLDFAEFQAIRQDVLLDFMAAIERNGSAIAFPTQTIHVAARS
jgi:hypothetical protein